MSKSAAISAITKLIAKHLKDEIMHWQQKALAASEANNNPACREALQAQERAIHNLIQLVEATK